MAANFYVNISEMAVGETSIDGTQSVSVSEAGQAETLYGDGDILPLEVRNGRRTITTTVVTNDLNHGIGVSDSFVRVSFLSLRGDNQLLSMAVVAEDGVVTSVSRNSNHNGRGQSTITIQHTSFDGSTSPLSFS